VLCSGYKKRKKIFCEKEQELLKSYSSRELIQVLEKDGWILDETVGSHHHFKHPTKKGKITVPHPRKDIGTGLLKAIVKQAGITIK